MFVKCTTVFGNLTYIILRWNPFTTSMVACTCCSVLATHETCNFNSRHLILNITPKPISLAN